MLVILIENILTSIPKKKEIYDENWTCNMNLNVWIGNKFLSSQKWQKIKFGTFQNQPVWVGIVSSSFFGCKCSFREISMIKIIILDQSNPIFPILKIKNLKFVHCIFIIYKNRNKASIQLIPKSNSTSFMFNNMFCEMKGKKLFTGRGLGWGELSKLLLGSVISAFTWISK